MTMNTKEAEILLKRMAEDREIHMAMRLWFARNPETTSVDFLRAIVAALEPVAPSASSF